MLNLTGLFLYSGANETKLKLYTNLTHTQIQTLELTQT